MAHWKHVVDCLLALLNFLLGVTAEVLRAKIDWKSAFCKGVGQSANGRPPPIMYARIDRRMNALQLCCW